MDRQEEEDFDEMVCCGAFLPDARCIGGTDNGTDVKPSAERAVRQRSVATIDFIMLNQTMFRTRIGSSNWGKEIVAEGAGRPAGEPKVSYDTSY